MSQFEKSGSVKAKQLWNMALAVVASGEIRGWSVAEKTQLFAPWNAASRLDQTPVPHCAISTSINRVPRLPKLKDPNSSGNNALQDTSMLKVPADAKACVGFDPLNTSTGEPSPQSMLMFVLPRMGKMMVVGPVNSQMVMNGSVIVVGGDTSARAVNTTAHVAITGRSLRIS